MGAFYERRYSMGRRRRRPTEYCRHERVYLLLGCVECCHEAVGVVAEDGPVGEEEALLA